MNVTDFHVLNFFHILNIKIKFYEKINLLILQRFLPTEGLQFQSRSKCFQVCVHSKYSVQI
jgi:hypothetical protein